MSILKDAKVGDQVEDSLGNKGTINYINETLGLYNVIFEADNRKCYTVDGNGYSTELQPTDSRLMTHIPAKKPTTFQALPVAAENYPTFGDTDVNGNIQILSPRGWEALATAFPYLDLTCFVFTEDCAEDEEPTVLVYSVNNGKVKVSANSTKLRTRAETLEYWTQACQSVTPPPKNDS